MEMPGKGRRWVPCGAETACTPIQCREKRNQLWHDRNIVRAIHRKEATEGAAKIKCAARGSEQHKMFIERDAA